MNVTGRRNPHVKLTKRSQEQVRGCRLLPRPASEIDETKPTPSAWMRPTGETKTRKRQNEAKIRRSGQNIPAGTGEVWSGIPARKREKRTQRQSGEAIPILTITSFQSIRPFSPLVRLSMRPRTAGSPLTPIPWSSRCGRHLFWEPVLNATSCSHDGIALHRVGPGSLLVTSLCRYNEGRERFNRCSVSDLAFSPSSGHS
jgi:hypothetical protein